MAKHNTLGEAGENAAIDYLQCNGYVIRHRNWRMGRLELDIVAAKGPELVVIEVKSRTNNDYIEPYEAVDWKKVKNIVLAADTYMKMFKIDSHVRFDIISIIGEEGDFKIEHIEEAFYPPVW